jgi:transposase InsO family protein
MGWMLEREGTKVNLKKVYRLYREEGLAVKRRRGRRRATGTRAPLAVPQASPPDQLAPWSDHNMDSCPTRGTSATTIRPHPCAFPNKKTR